MMHEDVIFLTAVAWAKSTWVKWVYVSLRSAQVRGSPNLLRRSRLDKLCSGMDTETTGVSYRHTYNPLNPS